MTTHCKVGDKPIVKYKFGDDTKYRIFKSQYAPIDVVTKTTPVEGTGNYNNEGYEVTFYSPNNFKFVSFIVKDWRTVDTGRYIEFQRIACGKNVFGTGVTEIDPNRAITFDYTKKCTPPVDSQRCSIEISHKGIILFQDQGKCPLDYSVQCGKCPDGQHECESNIYPYYCCNSCGETAAKIRSLASKVGR